MLVITQNVDRRHQRPEATLLIDLHGALATVVCAENCSAFSAREVLTTAAWPANPHLADHPRSLSSSAPTVESLARTATRRQHAFSVCEECGGHSKPD